MKANPLKFGIVVKLVKACWLVVVALDGFFCMVNSGFAQTWTQTSAPTNFDWIAVASSADGNKLVAAANSPVYSTTNPNCLYTSTDSGATWTLSLTNPYTAIVQWKSVASSANGSTLLAVSEEDLLYISTNFGTTWTQNNNDIYGYTLATCSADGGKLVAIGLGYNANYIYASTNSGATWTYTVAPDESWTTLASSADGTTLVGTAGAAGTGVAGLKQSGTTDENRTNGQETSGHSTTGVSVGVICRPSHPQN